MCALAITDVGTVPGDSGFLIDDGKTAILYDTGFAFTGEKLAENVKGPWGDRPLDYIFLTHSHYDHALGAAYVARAYPVDAVHLNTVIMIEMIRKEFEIGG